MRTNCLLAGFTLTALFSAGSAFAADPRLMNLLMPDARVVAGVNVTNARITPFGQYVLSQMTSSVDQQLTGFINTTGFDPRQDVSEIIAASSVNLTSPGGLLVALGNFRVDQLSAAIAKMPHVTLQNYGGATVITGGDAKNSFSIAFFGTNIAALGDAASVKAAVDRSAGANSINPALATRVQALSTTEDAWAVTLDPITSFIPGMSAGSDIPGMFAGIQASSGGVKFGASVDITAQAITTDPKNAKALADVVQALATIFSMSGGQDPQFASLAKLLQGVRVSADGTAMNLTLSIPEAQLETIMNGMVAQAKPMLRPGKTAAVN